MERWILDRIRRAQATSATSLDLSPHSNTQERLTVLPQELFDLESLETLNLAWNDLSALPFQIEKLKRLKHLVLSGNPLASLPASLASIESLEILSLYETNLRALPIWVSDLPSLTSLYLGCRKFIKVPTFIKRMNNLKDLGLRDCSTLPRWVGDMRWLESLDLTANELNDLPTWVTEMENIRRLDIGDNHLFELPRSISKLYLLESLNLWANSLRELPENFGELEALSELELAGNELISLPDSFRNLRRLQSLGLSNNRLNFIPDVIYELTSLQRLTIHNSDGWRWTHGSRRGDFIARNSITTISPKITNLPYLDSLSLTASDFTMPPPEVARKGISAIKNYFRQIDAVGYDYLYEAKLLIVGEPGAGKSTLAKKIIDPNYKLREERSTQGIDVSRWDFKMANGKNFRVNIWDFGGQEIYHATHQFFLTKRSLYALVTDTRREDTDFYYWLNLLELLTDGSPVLIIKNEKQDRRREISERQLRGQFSSLKDTMGTNLASNRGLNKINESIKHHISYLQHVGTRLPKSWVKVREVLETNPANYIDVEQYLEVCEKNGFSELKDKLQLSGYLHDLGVCLHFQEDTILKKIVILKPKWGTDAVYKILDNKKVTEAFGHFSDRHLPAIWHEAEYEQMHQELLRLMINFKLCYEIPGFRGNYIAPQLLSENQPAYQWDKIDNLGFRYSYEFMPKGIVSQFIVAAHALIADSGALVWKGGVILEKDDTRAEVIEHYGKRELQVRIMGKRKRDLMSIVSYELDKIHASYRQLKYAKLVPCNCVRCSTISDPTFFPMDVLKRFADDGQREIQCTKSYNMVGVDVLIDGVQSFVLNKKEIENRELVFNAPVGNVFLQHVKEGDTPISSQPKRDVRSAWASGTFYLFAFGVAIAGFGFLAGKMPSYVLALILVSAIPSVLLIGILQLRQDDRLSDKSFVILSDLVIRQLPVIGGFLKSQRHIERGSSDSGGGT